MGEDRREKLKSLATGWAKRTVKTTKLATALGGAAARKMVHVALELKEHHHDDGDRAALAAQAEAMVERMDQLKGLMMKFGQMASYLDGAMPEGAQDALRRLQRDSRPMEWAVVERTIQGSLGQPPDALFEDFEREPFAAASIGQVHRARIDGQPVAVKVQYPEIARTFDVDLKNLRVMSALGSVGTSLDSAELVAELRARLMEECDYLQEAAHQIEFRARLADTEGLHVPEVIAQRCGHQVLTTAFIDGQGFYDFAGSATQAQKNRVAERIFTVAFGSIFRWSLFNGDPHPGNYLFLGDDEVVLLDFGCVKTFEADFIDAWKRLALTVLDDQRGDFPEALRAVGFGHHPKFDFNAQWEAMRYLYRPFKTPGFRYDQPYIRQSYDALIWKNPNRNRTPMPAEWLLTNRLQWGLNSILAMLDAQANWGDIFREAVESPTVHGHRPAPLAPPQARA